MFSINVARKSFSLDGLWGYRTDENREGLDKGWANGFEPEQKVVVPSCLVLDGKMSYRGLAWFETEFEAEGLIEFKFDGVQTSADIWVDGQKLGSHYGGWSEFRFYKQLAPGKHVLVLAVDNTPNMQNTIPLLRVDWYHYGGISRSVVLSRVGQAFVKRAKLDYDLDLATGVATITPKVALLSDGKADGFVKVEMDGKVIAEGTVAADGEYHALPTVDVPVKLWDTDEPNLYNVVVSTVDDALFFRTGFRKIEARERAIYLNGNKVYFKAINRHDEHPDWGFSMPFGLIKRDLDLIKGMGMNAVRGAHYAHNKCVLDYCDEIGLLFWEEIPMWTYTEKHLQDDFVLTRAETMLEEMILRDEAHPCIVFWGVHNEVETEKPGARTATERLVKKVRSLDSSRLVTYASNRLFMEDTDPDICHDLVDVICCNTYPCWYTTEKTKKDTYDLDEWKVTLDEIFDDRDRNYPDMPVIISEFGAGGIYGVKEHEAVKWTEEYQELYFANTLPLLLNDERLSGFFIWQFADIRSCEDMILSRPRGFNNKGLFNENRKPKLAYYKVKEILGK